MLIQISNCLLFCSLLCVSSVSLAGIYEPNVLWNKKKIHACFLDQPEQMNQTSAFSPRFPKDNIDFKPAPFSDHEQNLIVELVSENFNSRETGVSFFGWEACSTLTDYDVIIVKAEPTKQFLFYSNMQFKGAASLGQGGIRNQDSSVTKAPGLKSFVAFSRVEPVSVVHEFGHVLGLRHEHIHPETAKDTLCKSRDFFTKERSMPRPSAKIHTAYDPESVMSYCVTQDPQRMNRPNFKYLSDLDRKTLSDLYRNKSDN